MTSSCNTLVENVCTFEAPILASTNVVRKANLGDTRSIIWACTALVFVTTNLVGLEGTSVSLCNKAGRAGIFRNIWCCLRQTRRKAYIVDSTNEGSVHTLTNIFYGLTICIRALRIGASLCITNGTGRVLNWFLRWTFRNNRRGCFRRAWIIDVHVRALECPSDTIATISGLAYAIAAKCISKQAKEIPSSSKWPAFVTTLWPFFSEKLALLNSLS
jgi:hypothetical protein